MSTVAPLPETQPTADGLGAPDEARGQAVVSGSPGCSSLPSLLDCRSSSRSIPSIQTFRLSFTNTRLASAREPRNVGIDNYTSLLH